jgi:hypothetical protein
MTLPDSASRSSVGLRWPPGVVEYVLIIGALLGLYIAYVARMSAGRIPAATVPTECSVRYAKARTPADSAIVDATAVLRGRAQRMLTCGDYRLAVGGGSPR